MSGANFGTDLLFELFSWMPAKGVIKYFSLDKTLARVLSEPFFHYKQAINSSRSNGGVFLQPDTSWDTCDSLDFHVLRTEPRSIFDIPYESVSFLQRSGRVLASSQGLVLLRRLVRGFAQGFLVCNPVTKSCTRLNVPDELRLDQFSDFGLLIECCPRKVDESCSEGDFPNDYIVAAPVLVDDETSGWGCSHRLAVYRSGRWDDELCDLRAPDSRQLRLDMPVGVFNGPDKGLVIHYLCDSLPNARRRVYFLEPYVVAYDVERKGSCGAFKLPKGAWMEDGDHSKLKIFKWGSRETLGLVRADERRLTVWKLDYERMSWRRVVAETTEAMGVPEEEGNVVGCCVVNGKQLLFATENQVYSYEMEGPEARRLEAVGEHGCRGVSRVLFTPYANTFRPVCGGGKRVVKF